jgi:hypothetical protein
LLPLLARSTGFAPVWSPSLGPQAGGIDQHPRPVQPPVGAQPVQQHQVQGIPYASLGPLGEPPPASRIAAAAQLLGGQQLPRDGGAGHVDDAGQAVAVGDLARPATAGVVAAWWQEGFDDLPELVWNKLLHQGSHGQRSSRSRLRPELQHCQRPVWKAAGLLARPPANRGLPLSRSGTMIVPARRLGPSPRRSIQPTPVASKGGGAGSSVPWPGWA